jgi:hypothetical protein
MRNFFYHLGLKPKIVILASVLMALTILLVAVLIGQRATRLAEADAKRITEETAWHYAHIIQAQLQVPLDETRALAKVFSGVLKYREDLDLSRTKVNLLLRHFIESSPHIIGMSVLFEPNAYDGLDQEFSATPGHDASGRFIPYWSRDASGKGVQEPLINYETEDYYLLPKQHRHEIITEAYVYPVQERDVLMTTVVVPILDSEERFIGMVTMDMDLESLQEVIETIKVANFEQAYASLFSAKGMVIASQAPGISTKQVHDISVDPDFNSAVMNGRMGLFAHFSSMLQEQVYSYVAPVEIGNSGVYWSVVVSIAAHEVMAGVRSLLFMIALIGVIVVVVSALVAAFIAHLLVKPLQYIVRELQALAQGSVQDSAKILNYKTKDEIGQILNANRQLKHSISATIEQANAIADGDYSHDICLLSDNDQLGRALQRMTSTLREMTARNDAQNWLKTGQTQLLEKISGVQDSTVLSENIIRFVCKYLDAQVGVFYLSQANAPVLKLSASYAYRRRKHLSNVFTFGEGLVGQAALEGKPIVLSQIPADYIEIESGSGKSAPENIIAFPFLYENTVKGVIEIGTLERLSALHMDFLSQIMPAIAVAVHSVQARTHIESVLAHLQSEKNNAPTQSYQEDYT